MSDVVIKVENLSKQYRLGVVNHGRLAKDLQSWWARVRGKEDPNLKIGAAGLRASADGEDRFWALKDISFEIRRGDRIGIVGRNGAGKSTLLKVLSRVTAPSTGQVKVKGRVASLLEVGTGFHGELTGRENVFLNGAILGLSKHEIRKRFDKIVDFSGVAKFIDTPVKRYSSGMYVRLAFAVAAHLEPDVLIIDEVLAVGDIEFQKKCLKKMEDVSKNEGRTVVFVSHMMGAIQQLCTSVILLSNGVINQEAIDVATAIELYEGKSQAAPSSSAAGSGSQDGGPPVVPVQFRLADRDGWPHPGPVGVDNDAFVEVQFNLGATLEDVAVGFVIKDEHNHVVLGSMSTDGPPDHRPALKEGKNSLLARLPAHLLNAGGYHAELVATTAAGTSLIAAGCPHSSFHFTVQAGSGDSTYWGPKRPGCVAPVLKWTTKSTRGT